MKHPESFVILAIFAQLLLTFVIMLMAGRARVTSIRTRETRIKDIALSDQGGWPARVRIIGNVMNNQWETPTLFYAISLLALHLQSTGVLFACLAWAYVFSRLGHAITYLRGNNVSMRFAWFLGGALVIMAMTLTLFVTWVATAP